MLVDIRPLHIERATSPRYGCSLKLLDGILCLCEGGECYEGSPREHLVFVDFFDFQDGAVFAEVVSNFVLIPV